MTGGSDLSAAVRRHLERHVPASDEELEALREALAPRFVRKHEVLSRQGELAPHLYFVERGCLRSYSTDARGVEHVVRFAVEGWWLSDLHSFFTGEPSWYSIDALEPSDLLVMTRAEQDRLCEAYPVFDRYFRKLLEGLAVASQRRLLGLLAGTAEDRYRQFMDTYRTIAQRLPQHQIASYLGVTPEALSRVRARRSRTEADAAS
jgi:CRP-like cAMP-binding protein